jgi:hypothetical protein
LGLDDLRKSVLLCVELLEILGCQWQSVIHIKI